MGSTAILDGIRIASPCQADWDAMQGDERVRFCSACGKDVYNISAMTLGEATTLIADRAEMPCLRLYRRADGTTLTGDCPVGARAARAGRFRRFAGLTLFGLTLASTGVASVAGEGLPDVVSASSFGANLERWFERAMIRLGLRKPAPVRLLGRAVMGEPAMRPIAVPPPPVVAPPAPPAPPGP